MDHLDEADRRWHSGMRQNFSRCHCINDSSEDTNVWTFRLQKVSFPVCVIDLIFLDSFFFFFNRT